MPIKSRPLTICLAQINFNGDDVPGHLKKIRGIIQDHGRADLIVFPELILHGHPSDARPAGYLYRQVRVSAKEAFRDMYGLVRAAGARVIFGELRRQKERYFNRASYVDADGVQSYIKTHVHWSEQFIPGRKLKTFKTPWGPLGINICFDSAFSEVWRVLALMGAEMAVNISAVPVEFPAQYMHRRLMGAAVFNQMFVIYANRPGPAFSGHSAVYGPRGDLLVQAGEEEAVVEVEIDLDEVARWREEERVFAHRRPLLYREVTQRGRAAQSLLDEALQDTA